MPDHYPPHIYVDDTWYMITAATQEHTPFLKWDTCINTEAALWTDFNYIHQNPVKHGYATKLEDWPFSSYRFYLKEKGVAWLEDSWRRYPVIDYLEGAAVDHPAG